MRILTVVGARPQFVKAAVVSRAIDEHNDAQPQDQVEEMLLHTGQHHDANMSDVFFDELGIRNPAINLHISGGSHGAMTGRMIEAIEREVKNARPDWVLVYGDTNSTLAGALAAAKLHVPVAHVEAGLRSFNRAMPEEINRRLTDHLSSLLFCPTGAAVNNLAREGIFDNVLNYGDVMYDASLRYRKLAEEHSSILEHLCLESRAYALATCHRAENTDDPNCLMEILDGFRIINENLPVVLPLHPRTRQAIEKFGFGHLTAPLKVIEPVSFLDMISLESGAKLILTDSGGVQKEAFFFGVPCLTLRNETEWVETVEAGWNRLTGANRQRIIEAFEETSEQDERPELYGRGDAGRQIVGALLRMVERPMRPVDRPRS